MDNLFTCETLAAARGTKRGTANRYMMKVERENLELFISLLAQLMTTLMS